jgi:hypothetical protein
LAFIITLVITISGGYLLHKLCETKLGREQTVD